MYELLSLSKTHGIGIMQLFLFWCNKIIPRKKCIHHLLAICLLLSLLILNFLFDPFWFESQSSSYLCVKKLDCVKLPCCVAYFFLKSFGSGIPILFLISIGELSAAVCVTGSSKTDFRQMNFNNYCSMYLKLYFKFWLTIDNANFRTYMTTVASVSMNQIILLKEKHYINRIMLEVD